MAIASQKSPPWTVRGLAVGIAVVALAGVTVAAQAPADNAKVNGADGGEPSATNTEERAREASVPAALDAAVVATPVSPDSGAAVSESGSTLPSSSTTGPAASPVAAAKAPAGDGVRGVTDDTIYVGWMDFDLAAAAAGIGAVSGSPVEAENAKPRDMGNAVVKYLNERGGFAGRKVEIVWAYIDAAQYVTPEGRRRQQQQTCATWTEDNEVFAFLGQAMSEDLLLDCARTSNSVIVPHVAGPPVDEQVQREMKNLWYSLTRMVGDRRERNLVKNLVERGVLTPNSKVGIMIEDRPATKRAVSNGMERELAAHGIEVVAKAVYPDIVESPWATYTLQFRQAGVTHVLFSNTFSASTGWPTLFMQREAENQGWNPIWGIGSDNHPGSLAILGAVRNQMANTYVMGWQPPYDVIGTYDPSDTRSVCARIEKEHGFPEHYADPYCDVLMFFQQAMNRANEVSPAGMDAAMDSLGETFQSISAVSARTSFSRQRHDGVATQRDVVYDDRCSDDGVNCWKYAGEARPMP